jgi:serine/threonine protein kinase
MNDNHPPSPPPPPTAQPMDEKPLQVGKLFGAYTLKRIIAEGGMGVVIEAEHNVIKRTVALKTVSPKYAAKEGFRLALLDTFMRDARILGSIDHPNVLPIFDAGTIGHCPFIAMRMVNGGDLATWITTNGAVKEDVVLHLAHDCAAGLKAIHGAGYLHRDIKPLNLLIEEDWRVFISDFGLALPKGKKPPAGTIAGTPCYLAPEQIRGEDLDERIDIYALGATLYHAATGSLPFNAPTPEEIMRQVLDTYQSPDPRERRPDLDERLATIIKHAMAPKAADRYRSTDEMIADCKALMQGGALPFAGGGKPTRKSSVFGQIASRVFGGNPNPAK